MGSFILSATGSNCGVGVIWEWNQDMVRNQDTRVGIGYGVEAGYGVET